MIDEEKLIETLRNFLPSIRWWPGEKIDEKTRIKIVDLLTCEHGFLTLFEVNNQLFQLPMVRVDEVPDQLRNRYIEYGGEYYVEAEYTPYYIELMEKLGVEHEDFKPINGRVVEARPLTLETTNVVGLQIFSSGLKLVVKSYRLLPRIDLEPRMLIKLSRENYRYIPPLYRAYSLKIMGRKTYLSLMTQYIEGYSDGGYPFYTRFKNYLEKRRSSEKLSLDMGCYTRLARLLGYIIADMHVKLNPQVSHEFFGLEPVSQDDIEIWIKRIENRYRWIMDKLEDLENGSKGVKKQEYGYWKNQIMKYYKEWINVIFPRLDKLYIDTYKGRIHQDLHLQQMIYVESIDSFIITDFEGEPGRSDEERGMKEPLIRDLATMINSFHYLSFMTYHEVIGRGKSLFRTAKKLMKQKTPLTWEWIVKHMVNMILTYSHATSQSSIGRDLFGYKKSLSRYYHLYLPIWILDRTLYEIEYELKYRQDWFVVPAVVLKHQPIPIT